MSNAGKNGRRRFLTIYENTLQLLTVFPLQPLYLSLPHNFCFFFAYFLIVCFNFYFHYCRFGNHKIYFHVIVVWLSDDATYFNFCFFNCLRIVSYILRIRATRDECDEKCVEPKTHIVCSINSHFMVEVGLSAKLKSKTTEQCKNYRSEYMHIFMYKNHQLDLSYVFIYTYA